MSQIQSVEQLKALIEGLKDSDRLALFASISTTVRVEPETATVVVTVPNARPIKHRPNTWRALVQDDLVLKILAACDACPEKAPAKASNGKDTE